MNCHWVECSRGTHGRGGKRRSSAEQALSMPAAPALPTILTEMLCDEILAASCGSAAVCREADQLDRGDQNLSDGGACNGRRRACHARGSCNDECFEFLLSVRWDAVKALLSMRENIGETLERMRQEVDDPGFLERKIGYVLEDRMVNSPTITRLQGAGDDG